MTEERPKRRRWFQFRLRTLIISVLLLSLPLSWFATRVEMARRQREAAEVIRQLGGEISYDWDIIYSQHRSLMGLREPNTLTWILRATLDKEFSDVVAVTLRDDPPDADLAILKAFPNLRSLEVVCIPVTDEGIRNIAGVTTLRSLLLDNTGITMAGVKKLGVALPGCGITTLTSQPVTNDAAQ